MSNLYKESGVDTEKGQVFVQNIKSMVESTFSKNVMGTLGGFCGQYDVSFLKEYKSPVLLSATDGVGTKLEIAKLLDKHDTVGIDLVAMCVNDILVSGGKPHFFLDYIATGKLDLQKQTDVLKGIVEGCRQAECSLLGGETAEHPGVMKEDDYDLAGFAVGACEKDQLTNPENCRPGDVILGIQSSGLHSNGFSLVRKLLLDQGKYLPKSKDTLDFLQTEVFVPTKIYVKSILNLLSKTKVSSLCHITGGGYYENIPRSLAKNTKAIVRKSALPKLPVFEKLEKDYHLSEETLFNTYNMGLGFLVFLRKESVEEAISILQASGEAVHVVGNLESGSGIEIQ